MDENYHDEITNWLLKLRYTFHFDLPWHASGFTLSVVFGVVVLAVAFEVGVVAVVAGVVAVVAGVVAVVAGVVALVAGVGLVVGAVVTAGLVVGVVTVVGDVVGAVFIRFKVILTLISMPFLDIVYFPLPTAPLLLKLNSPFFSSEVAGRAPSPSSRKRHG